MVELDLVVEGAERLDDRLLPARRRQDDGDPHQPRLGEDRLGRPAGGGPQLAR